MKYIQTYEGIDDKIKNFFTGGNEKSDKDVEEPSDDIKNWMNDYTKEDDNMEQMTYDLLFSPSGEVLEISDKELGKLNDYIEIEYDKELDSYLVNDDHRHVVTFVLKK